MAAKKKIRTCKQLLARLIDDTYMFKDKRYLKDAELLHNRGSSWGMCAVGENQKIFKKAGVKFWPKSGGPSLETTLGNKLDSLGSNFGNYVAEAYSYMKDYFCFEAKHYLISAKKNLRKARTIYMKVEQLAITASAKKTNK